MSNFPSASYDDWKLMSPDEEAERIFGPQDEDDSWAPDWLCACLVRYCGAAGNGDIPDACPDCGGPVLVRQEPEEDDDGLPF